MKYILTSLICFFLATISLFAQEVKEKKDIIYVDDTPYAKIVEKKILSSIEHLTLMTLSGKEILKMEQQPGGKYYNITILETGEVFQMQTNFAVRKDLFELFVEFKLVGENGINKDAARLFGLMLNSGNTIEEADAQCKEMSRLKTEISNAVPLTKRQNTSGKLKVVGEKIYQDSILIGKFEYQFLGGYNGVKDRYLVFNTKGTLIAYMYRKQENDEVEVVTTNTSNFGFTGFPKKREEILDLVSELIKAGAM